MPVETITHSENSRIALSTGQYKVLIAQALIMLYYNISKFLSYCELLNEKVLYVFYCYFTYTNQH